MWMLVNCKNGVSSYEIARATGITQKSSWFVLQRLRLVLKDTFAVKMGGEGHGPIEADETYIGGKPKNMHQKRRLARRIGTQAFADKAIVFGMLNRDTREVRAKVIPVASRKVLQKEIFDNLHYKATVYTDQWSGYDELRKMRYIHDTVNHMKEYVRGEVHTQAIENFWSCLKRTLQGTYVCVEPVHLDRYLDEQMFRFNNRRNMNDGTRFQKALSQVKGKRLTYAELTGKEAASAA
jgi:transposase-like protein